jgi:carbon-monoxide dehydrogenase medium subunit
MRATAFHRPASLADAARLFAGFDEPAFLSGGHTLIPAMKQRLAAPSDLIDLTRIEGMRGIRLDGDTLVIGAATTHAEVAASDVVRRAIPALAGLAGSIGDPMVRHRGTIGGSVANNDPSADYPSAVLALGASVVTDRRSIAADDFFTGLLATALAPGEIVTAIRFPVPASASYAKFRNPASRYAMAGAFVARLKGGAVRVAITGTGASGVFRATAFEKALAANFARDAITGLELDPGEMLADIHGSAEYRANLAKVMAMRAVAAPGEALVFD